MISVNAVLRKLILEIAGRQEALQQGLGSPPASTASTAAP